MQRIMDAGDVMIFTPHFTSDKGLFIKRVIGLPGETVESKDGVVYIDGEPLTERYIKAPVSRDFAKTRVAPGEYFMMGDNRNNSIDSRAWGTVKYDQLEGRALFVFWPPAHAGSLALD